MLYFFLMIYHQGVWWSSVWSDFLWCFCGRLKWKLKGSMALFLSRYGGNDQWGLYAVHHFINIFCCWCILCNFVLRLIPCQFAVGVFCYLFFFSIWGLNSIILTKLINNLCLRSIILGRIWQPKLGSNNRLVA